MNSSLLMKLRKAGHVVHVLSRNGTKMLILKDGGRIIGLYAPDSEENFLWSNPCISDDPESVFNGKWPNPGGDRCWFSPVCSISSDSKSVHTVYQVPPIVDPGSHLVERLKDGTLRLCIAGSVFMRHRGKHDTFALERYISWAPNPLRYAGDVRAGKLSYSGYSQRICLESFSCIVNKLSPWSILQLPVGGEIVIPVYGRSSTVRHALGIGSSNIIKFDGGNVRIRADGEKDFMVSIPPQMSTGRIGYVRNDGKDWILIVRNFHVNPSGEYMNCFSGMSKMPGYAVQCRIVSEGELSHVELHHHIPATSSQLIHDTSQTWCFRGSRGNIRRAALCLLGITVQKQCV